jgi:hypothetical protein
MTRRRKMFALLGALGVVAVIIFVVTRPRGAEVELKLVGWGRTGEARFKVSNNSRRTVMFQRAPRALSEANIAWTNGRPTLLTEQSMFFDYGWNVPPRTNVIIEVKPPPTMPWRVGTVYIQSGGFMEKVRLALARAGVMKPLVQHQISVVSEPITNTPPVP